MLEEPRNKQDKPGKSAIWQFWGCFGIFCGKYYGKNSRKAPYNYSASFSINNFSISLWENQKT